jgi:uncharacterized protein
MPENQTDTIRKKNSSILITGGTGLIGKYLTSVLLSEGYKVCHLSRNAGQSGNIRVFEWNPEQNIADPSAFDGIDCIIHLAGANIGEKRWTENRRKEIVKSRVDSARLLFNIVSNNRIPLKTFISASAAGYYGSVTSDIIHSEEDMPGTDFLGTTCKKWEDAADLFADKGIRTVKIRTAVVLEKNDSALSKLMLPARFGFLVQTGNGRQYMPWIHIIDLCNIYLKAIRDENMSGPYNAVSPQHTTHKEFIRTLAREMNCPVFPVHVPEFVLRIILGNMSDVILKGSRVSSVKTETAGYIFRYPVLEEALKNIIRD